MNKASDLTVDHIFGDINLPKKGAAFVIKRLKGVHHWSAKCPAIPRPDQAVTLTFTTSADLPVQAVKVVFTTNEWQTSQTLECVETSQRWSTLLWGWLRTWQVTLPPQPVNTMLRYQAWAELTHSAPKAKPERIYADNQTAQARQASQFAIWYGKDQLPDWSKDARVYQIFVDRFNPGGTQLWSQTASLNQPMGGTLRGVIDRLDHIASFGFNAIWLSPIFKSPSHHGYDTSDYTSIEPRLGNEADLRELLDQAHARGIRVILDFVANHTSSQHQNFQAALSDRSSPYREWYNWSRWPHYRSFFNVRNMPQLNLSYGSPARAHLLEVARQWLEFGVDGYRLDYAHGPEPDFWVDFRQTCAETNPDCWTFGEVVSTAEVQASFAGGMHGTLDFLTCQALRESIARRTSPLSMLAAYLEFSAQAFPLGFSRPAFIDNHDMNRFLFTAGGDERLLEVAITLLYLLPQPVIVYAGTEIALNHRRSIHQNGAAGFDESRVPMIWNDQNRLEKHQKLFQELSQLRERYHGFAGARWKCLLVDDQKQLALWKISANNQPALHLAVNLGDTPQTILLPDHDANKTETTIASHACHISKV